MNKNHFLASALCGGALALAFFASCTDKDLYDADYVTKMMQENAKENFPVQNIDANQTWEMVSRCTAEVAMFENTGKSYDVMVFTENPYNINSSAKMLTKKAISDGMSASWDFDIPTAMKTVYVVKQDSEGFSSMIPATIENETLKVNFGLVETKTVTRATRAGSDFFFTPVVPKASDYPAAVPSDATEYVAHECVNGKNYTLDGTYDKLAIENGGNFYISGNVTLNDWVNPQDTKQANFYLLPGATLTVNADEFDCFKNSVISVGEGAKLVAKTYKTLAYAKTYVKGTIEADKIIITNDNDNTSDAAKASIFYNQGKVVTESLAMTNGASKYCNASGSELKAGSVQCDGGSHFLNEADAKVTVDGETNITSTNGSWENAGHYTTNTMTIFAWNDHNKNACWLTVDDKLTISDGGIQNESYISCKYLDTKNFSVLMADQSLFNVDETATCYYTEAFNIYNTGAKKYGFVAEAKTSTSKGCIVKIGKVRRTGDNHYMNYWGHMVVACDDHDLLEKDAWNVWVNFYDGASLSGTNSVNVSIPSSNCNPGYKASGSQINSDPMVYTYAFEDMLVTEASDYDWNDVVLQVSAPVNGKVKVKLVAAGATHSIAVKYGSQTLWTDVHNALGVASGTMVNTDNGTETASPVETTIDVNDSWTITDNGDFYIRVEDTNDVHIPTFTSGFQPGDVPYAICVPCKWAWPKERIAVNTAYTGFNAWATDATQEATWYNTPTAGNVCNP